MIRPRDPRQALRFAAVAGVVAALLLAGCGRKGPLDPPAGAWEQQVIPTTQVVPQTGGVTVQGTTPTDDRPVAAKGLRRPLPMDVLID